MADRLDSDAVQQQRDAFDEAQGKALIAALGRLSTSTERLGSVVTQASTGQLAGGAAAALSSVAAATGSEKLDAIASVLNVIAPLLDKLVTYVAPELVAEIRKRTGSSVSKAGEEVSALAEDAAAHGFRLPADFLRAQIEFRANVFDDRAAESDRVKNIVSEVQVGRLLGHK